MVLGGDLTHCAAAFALLGGALAAPTSSKPTSANTNEVDAEYGRELIALAERLHAKTGGGMDQLISLFMATGKPEYRQGAEKRAAELISRQRGEGLVGFRELAEFAIAFPEDERVPAIRELAIRRLVDLRKRCDPRFGIVCDSDAAGRLIYFRAYSNVNDWYVGDASLRLDAAIDALYAARLGATEGKAVAEQQVHWLLGCNPFVTSYLEGIGSRFVPGYHHRYNSIAGNPRGAVPGALINGRV